MNELYQEKQKRILFWGLLLLLLGLCIVRYALQVNFPQIILLGVVILAAFISDENEIIALCICCIPLDTSINVPYALLACILIYCLKYSSEIKINLTVVPILLMVIWELMHCFEKPFSIPSFASDVAPLLMLALLMWLNAAEIEYDLVVRAVAVSVAAMCVLLLGKLVYAANFNLLAVFANLQRLGLDSEEVKSNLSVLGGEQNPNTLGIMCVLGMTGLMQIRLAGRKKPGDMALAIFLLVFGVLTSSRTYIVCLSLMAVLLLFSQKGSVSKKLKFIGVVLVGILVALCVLYLLFPTLLEFYIGRFRVEDVTTGRLDLMRAYHEFIVSDPRYTFFGIGLHGFYRKVMEVYRVAKYVPHNGIQELIIAWGLPGLFLFIALWAVMIWRSRQCCKKQGLINYIPLIIILVKAQAGQMLDSSYTMLAFSYAYLSMCANLTSPEPQALDETT